MIIVATIFTGCSRGKETESLSEMSENESITESQAAGTEESDASSTGEQSQASTMVSTAKSKAQSSPQTGQSSNAVSKSGPQSNAQTEPIVISLPFETANVPREMMPMGETINHPDPPNPGGHPGIDFMWDNSVNITACADGTVSKVEFTSSHNKWDVFIDTGGYSVGYTTLETVNDKIKVGNQVTAGQKVGSSGDFGTHNMIHWELRYKNSGQRVCPMAYFDNLSRQRILNIWENTKWPEMKEKFPHICNYVYRCNYCQTHGY